MKTARLLFLLLLSPLLFSCPARATDLPTGTPTVPEIPYYIRQLEQATTESKRMQCDKIIHDAVVKADLSDKKTVKQLEPIVKKIQAAINSGLDRAYLEGESMWLGSAVDYFERQKLRPVVSIPESDWMPAQTASSNGASISIFPDKILIFDGRKTATAAESANIHEAIISPDGKKIAFFRQTDDDAKAEVWMVDVKNRRRKKIAVIASCETLLFSLAGNRLFLQEKPDKDAAESILWSIPAAGGSLKKIGTVRFLETLAAKGPHKGALIVYKKTLHHLGTTSTDCAYAWSESGKEVGRLKEGPCR